MENELDLDNLTKEDFLEMAKYVHHLQQQNGNIFKYVDFEA